MLGVRKGTILSIFYKEGRREKGGKPLISLYRFHSCFLFIGKGRGGKREGLIFEFKGAGEGGTKTSTATFLLPREGEKPVTLPNKG